jgi:hypothetical protein
MYVDDAGGDTPTGSAPRVRRPPAPEVEKEEGGVLQQSSSGAAPRAAMPSSSPSSPRPDTPRSTCEDSERQRIKARWLPCILWQRLLVLRPSGRGGTGSRRSPVVLLPTSRPATRSPTSSSVAARLAAHLPPLPAIGAERNGLPWGPRLVLSRVSLPPLDLKEMGRRQDFDVSLEETAAVGKTLFVSSRRRIKALVHMVLQDLKLGGFLPPCRAKSSTKRESSDHTGMARIIHRCCSCETHSMFTWDPRAGPT